ncbi:MAG: FeoB-associated Cys-rich membrane protein [Pseudobutyrivibrio sp.]|nr:FeoB-associated Cys-rich membrane protein [Pseudobutyrivibrio sp.]
MISWITANIGTIVVAAVLLLIVAGVVRSMIKDRKNGCSSCGCGCSGCSGSCSCESTESK